MAGNNNKPLSFIGLDEIEVSRIKSPRYDLRGKRGNVAELKDSIFRQGLLHPLVIRKARDSEDEFELISGARRLEAIKQLGVEKVSCEVQNVSAKDGFELALVENLQRMQLDPIEEAWAFRHYIKVCKWGSLSDLAKRIGKSKEYICHRMKLLDLPEEVIEMIGEGLTASHAEELCYVGNARIQTELANTTVAKKLSVKELHNLIDERCSTKSSHNDVVNCNSRDMEASDWLPKQIKTKIKSSDQTMQNILLALRYTLSYIDDCVSQIEKEPNQDEFIKFVIHERYLLHEIIDHFVSASTSRIFTS